MNENFGISKIPAIALASDHRFQTLFSRLLKNSDYARLEALLRLDPMARNHPAFSPTCAAVLLGALRWIGHSLSRAFRRLTDYWQPLKPSTQRERSPVSAEKLRQRPWVSSRVASGGCAEARSHSPP